MLRSGGSRTRRGVPVWRCVRSVRSPPLHFWARTLPAAARTLRGLPCLIDGARTRHASAAAPSPHLGRMLDPVADSFGRGLRWRGADVQQACRRDG